MLPGLYCIPLLSNIGRNKERKLIDAEADFIFVHAEYGLLFVEVKGGDIRHERGKWSQNGKLLDKSPAEQARHNRYNIEEYVDQNMKSYGNISYSFAACFPNVFTDFNLTLDLQSITLTGNELTDLKSQFRTRIPFEQKLPEHNCDL